MVLKINLNGKKVSITGTNQPPITFIDGEKKRLTRGITFINGQKKVLWDIYGLQIDYITGLSQISGNSWLYPVFVNQKNLVLYASNNNIIKYNIENVSSPVVESTVKLGQVCGFSLPDSTDDNLVYYAYTTTSPYVAQQININPSTCEISASNTVSFTATPGKGGLLGTNSWLGWKYKNAGRVVRFYLNNTLAYSYAYYSGSGSVSGSGNDPFLAKRDASTFIGTKPTVNLGDSIATYNATELQERISGVDYRHIMVDDAGNIAAAGLSGFGLYNQSFDVIKQVSPTGANRTCALLGRIRDYYYVGEYAYNKNAGDTNVYLRIFDANTGELFEQHTLDLPAVSNWSNVDSDNLLYTMPQLSKTGALVFVWRPGVTATENQNTVVVRVQGY